MYHKFLFAMFGLLLLLAAVEVYCDVSMQESLEELLVGKRWYADRDDFTVVMQDSPFITGPSSVSVS